MVLVHLEALFPVTSKTPSSYPIPEQSAATLNGLHLINANAAANISRVGITDVIHTDIRRYICLNAIWTEDRHVR